MKKTEAKIQQLSKCSPIDRIPEPPHYPGWNKGLGREVGDYTAMDWIDVL